MKESLTELSEISNRLAQEINAFRSIAEFCNDGIWDWKIPTNYEYMSPRFWEILGQDPKTKKHCPTEWQKLIHPEDLIPALGEFDTHVESRGATPYKLKVRYLHPVKGWIRVLCRGRVIEWSETGEPIRMVGTHTLLD